VKITNLQIDNVKRITAVSITPDGSMVTISGRNGQGKSSVLDAIAYALGGTRLQPPEVIHRGAEFAQVLLETETYTIKRRWTGNDKSTISVYSKEGAKFPSPQALLDKLVGRLSFDPLSFMRMTPKEQAAALRQLVGLDFTDLDARRRGLFEERAGVNRELAATTVLLDSTTHYPDAPAAPVSLSALLVEESDARAEAEHNEHLRKEAVAVSRAVREVEQRVEDAKDAFERAKSVLAAAYSGLAEAQSAEISALKACEGLEDPDLQEIRSRLESVEQINNQVHQNARRAELAQMIDAAKAEEFRLSRAISKIDVEKARALAEAPFPVPGLSFDGDLVTFQGLPLEQAADSERLRVAVGIGLAMNPTLKVLLIRDGSLLDEDSLAMVGEMAETAGAQVWIEVVSKGGVGVVIEDGQVYEPAEATTPCAVAVGAA
jgi:hypothetical protein